MQNLSVGPPAAESPGSMRRLCGRGWLLLLLRLLRRLLLGRGLGLPGIAGHALFEAADTFAEPAHDFGDSAAPKEDQHDQEDDE